MNTSDKKIGVQIDAASILMSMGNILPAQDILRNIQAKHPNNTWAIGMVILTYLCGNLYEEAYDALDNYKKENGVAFEGMNASKKWVDEAKNEFQESYSVFKKTMELDISKGVLWWKKKRRLVFTDEFLIIEFDRCTHKLAWTQLKFNVESYLTHTDNVERSIEITSIQPSIKIQLNLSNNVLTNVIFEEF